jgi:hypothetical protein
MFAEYGAEISQTGKTTKFAYFSNCIFARLQQIHGVIEPDGFDKIGW